MIQEAYQKLWAWHGKYHLNSEFRNYSMQGYLKKRVQKLKFWQKGEYNKRFFILDFTIANIQIKTTKEETNKENIKKVPFRNIISCYLPNAKSEERIRQVCSKTYRFPFFLKTLDRMYELCSSSEEERNMWIAGFSYIIVSTSQV